MKKTNFIKHNRHIITFLCLILLLILVPIVYLFIINPMRASAAWYGTAGWKYRQKITINYTKVSAGPHSSFPVMVKITDAKLRAAQSTGNDLLFTSSDGVTKLNHEIETFDQRTGSLIAWVASDVSSTANTILYVYYGNPQAADQSSKTAVWDASTKAVYHLKENPAGSAPQMTDSTTTPKDGTTYGTMAVTQQIAGQIDGSLNFISANSNYISAADNAKLRPGNGSWTVSAWAKAPNSSQVSTVVSKMTLSGAYPGFFLGFAADDTGGTPAKKLVGIFESDYTNNVRNAWTTADVADGSWHLLSMVADKTADSIKLYVDGTLITSTTTHTAGTWPNIANTDAMTIGSQQGAGNYFNGQIDEVQISNTNRSAGWLLTEYNNQYSPQTFLSFGLQEKSLDPISYWKMDDGQGTTLNDSGVAAMNGTLNGVINNPTWQTEDLCVSGKCLYFEGSNATASANTTLSDIKSVSFWTKPASSSGTIPFVSFSSGNGNISVTSSNLTVSTTGITSPTVYVNGAATTTLTANQWNHVEITTSTSFTATNLVLGKILTTYFKGFLDDFKLYDYTRNADQVKTDYNAKSAAALAGAGTKIGAQTTDPLNKGLVGYWKMDEATWSGTTNEVLDTSGNSNHGAAQGPAIDMPYTTRGKFGNGGLFDGINDYVNIASSTTMSPSSQMTVSGWFNPSSTFSTSSNYNQGIIDKGDYQFYLDKTDGKAHWVVNDSVAKAFAALGTGMGNQILALTVWNGNLYASGSFTSAGSCTSGNGCNYIAKWDGANWTALGTGTNNLVYALTVWNGNLYAAGYFTAAGSCSSNCNYVAKWDGANWSALDTGISGGRVRALTVWNGNLYAGGDFTNAGSCGANCARIAKWDGASWSALSTGMGSFVYTLAVWNGNLYAGGYFTSAGSCTSDNGCKRIAKWDGTSWSALGAGVGGAVVTIATWNGNLYAGGYFTSAGSCTSGNGCKYIAKWDGASWSALDTGIGTGGYIRSLSVWNGYLYAGGSFATAGSCTSNCTQIAKWDGTTWSALDTGIGSYNVFALAVWNGNLYAGGDFTTAGSCSSGCNYITKWGTSNNTTISSTTTSWTGNAWYHFAVTSDGSKLSLFINGELQNSVASAISLNTSSTALYLGSTHGTQWAGGSGEYYNGTIDETRIYNRALTAAEISQLYNFTPGPVGYWKMDEGRWTNNCSTNTVFDSSGNGLNGISCPNASGPTGGVPGKYGKAGTFDGTEDYLQVADSPYLSFGNGTTDKPFSVSAWTYVTSANTFPLVYKGIADGSAVEWEIDFNWGTTDGTVELTLWDNTTSNYIYAYMTNPLTNYKNQWIYVTVTYDGVNSSGIKIYINGAAQAMSTGSSGSYTAIHDTANPLYIATIVPTDATNKGFAAGGIDDLKIYNYVLSQKQIDQDMSVNRPISGSLGSSVLWKFDEGQGLTARDSSNTFALSLTTATDGFWAKDCKFGNCLVTNGGATPRLARGTAYSMFNGLTQMTLSFWVKPRTLTANTVLVSKSDMSLDKSVCTATGQCSFTVAEDATNADELRVYIHSSLTDVSNYYTTTNLDLVNNVWDHVVVVYDGTLAAADRIKVYKNKTLVSGTVTGTIPVSMVASSTDPFTIGASYSPDDDTFYGLFDEFKIYNSPLTASEISTEFNHSSSLSLGVTSDTSGLTGGSVASSSASSAYCIPGDTSTCTPPVAEWTFDEGRENSCNGGVNDVCDTSGNGNDGAWNGTGLNHWVPGKIGKAGNFNGSDNYVASTKSISSGTAGTTEAWFKPSGSYANNQILMSGISSVGTAATARLAIGLIATGTCASGDWLSIVANGTSAQAVCSGQLYNALNFPAGVWTHLAVTYDGSFIKFYKDSFLVRKVAQTVSGAGNAQPYSVGRMGGYNGLYANGQIDQARIYNYARTPAQITWDYNRGAPLGYWKLDECTGTTLNDSISATNSAALTIGATGTYTSAGTCTDGLTTTSWYAGATGKYNASVAFDGSNDSAAVTTGLNYIQSISFWAKPASNSQSYLQLNTGQYITSSNGTITATGFGTPSVYVNGVLNGTVTASQWNHIVVTSATSLCASAIKFGIQNTTYYSGLLDEIKIYNYPLTATQVKTEYNQGSAVRFGPTTGSP